MSLKRFLSAVLMVASVSAIVLTSQQDIAQVKPSARKGGASHLAAQQDEGQRIFEQHCSRCHNAPDGFSPHISGTVVRHMRVRASLSQHEEEELLHFFNP